MNRPDSFGEAPPTSAVLEISGVSKHYGATKALVDVSFELRTGEVHSLLGENAAGKSTLVKIIAGLERQDVGKVLVRGHEIGGAGVKAARAAGVGVVYQHPVVFPDVDVTENIFAGRPILRRSPIPIVNAPAMKKRVQALFERMDVDINPAARMRDLSAGQRQLVEIAKALSEEIRILVLDEPTAALPDKDVASLFSIVRRRLAADGIAILFISHRLDEVFEISDRVTVLRDGRKVATEPVADLSKDHLIKMMVGHQLDIVTQGKTEPGDAAVEVSSWCREGAFTDVSLSVRRGEVVGLAGLVGAGGSDVARTMFGIEPVDRGVMRIGGKQVLPRSPRQMMAAGLAYLPEDRQGTGLITQWPIFRNISLPILSRISRLKSIPRSAAEREIASHYVNALDIRPDRTQELVANLSGGNQQKVLLSKWLATKPQVLILEEPTAGIDIGARNEVHALIGQLAREGLALIVVSSDVAELLSVTHRVLVFSAGRVVAHLRTAEASREAIMRAATGAPPDAAGRSAHSGREARSTNSANRNAPAKAASILPAPRAAGRRRLVAPAILVRDAREAGIVAALIIVVAVFGLLTDNFLTLDSVWSILSSSATAMAVAAGMTAVILARQIDLSVGAILGLGAYTVGAMLDAGFNPLMALGASLIVGTSLGAVNGFVVTRLRVPAIVATLGTATIYRGLLFIIAPHVAGFLISADQIPAGFRSLSRLPILGVPVTTIIAGVVATVIGLVIANTPWGRNLHAIGSNPEAARFAGIPARSTVFAALTLVGATAGLGGFLYVMRYATVGVRAGTGFDFEVISAVVIGGVAIFGGSGRVFGAILGVIMLNTLSRGFTLMNIPEFWKVVATGVAIIAAVAVDSTVARRRVERIRMSRRLRAGPSQEGS